MTAGTDRAFAGSIPERYEALLVPLIFEPYAADLAARAAALAPRSVLELAAGTGAVTRHLASLLPHARIVATDLNAPMLEIARSHVSAPVEWRQADAMSLPFAAGEFDLVVCQFGAMFFPDRPAAFAEAARVLRPGGWLLFNVWDRIESNEFAAVVSAAIAPLFGADPPRFLERLPHGYHDAARIGADVVAAGFEVPQVHTSTFFSRGPSPQAVAIGYCEGTPLRNEIEARGGAAKVAAATAVAEAALAGRFGRGTIEGRIQALIVVARRP